MPSLEDRFWEKVEVAGPDECWEWQAYKDGCGYGQIFREKIGGIRHNDRAHRISWELHNGPIPADLQVLHTCDNPPCCNPAHLWLGTPADNAADREEKGRGNRGHVWGEGHGQSKLTEDQVLEIRMLYATGGITHQALANRHGVTREAISRIMQGRTWSYLL